MQVDVMDDIAVLLERRRFLNTILENEPLDMAEGLAIADEMIEIDIALQKRGYIAPLEQTELGDE